MKIPANHNSVRSSKIPIMKKTILALALAAGLTSFAGTAKAAPVTFTSTPNYVSVPVPATLNETFSSVLYGVSDSYITTISYGDLPTGAVFSIYTTDTFHVYGPYGQDYSSWNVPYNDSEVSVQATLGTPLPGGSFDLHSSAPITAVTYSTTIMENQLDGYITTISYGDLLTGAVFSIYTTDTFHVYGPSGQDGSSWSVPYNSSGVSVQATLGNPLPGGSFDLFSSAPITDVSYQVAPEPSTYALFGMGALGILIVLRRKKAA